MNKPKVSKPDIEILIQIVDELLDGTSEADIRRITGLPEKAIADYINIFNQIKTRNLPPWPNKVL